MAPEKQSWSFLSHVRGMVGRPDVRGASSSAPRLGFVGRGYRRQRRLEDKERTEEEGVVVSGGG